MPLNPEFAGIEPRQLDELINTLERGVTRSAGLLTDWRAAALDLGLDLDDLTAMERSADWSRRQIPMLRLRLALAESMDGPASAGVAAGSAETELPAAMDGAADGARLADGDDPVRLREGLADLLERSGDAGYAHAVYLTLGARGIAALGTQHRRYLDRGLHAEAELLERSVGLSLATASHKMSIDDDWLDEVAAGEHGFDPALLVPLFRHGTFSDQWLQVVGDRLLREGAPAGEMWEVLVRHPEFAAGFCAANREALSAEIIDQLGRSHEDDAESPEGTADRTAPAGAR